MKADKILLSNAVFTGEGEAPFPGGVAIKDNKIMAVGSRESLEAYMGSETELFSYGDNLIMPGICEAHGHFPWGALYASDYFLDKILESGSEEECAAMVKEFADAHPDHRQILGQGWFPANWNDAPLPTKASLDAAVPDRPVYLAAADAHTGWLNSAALKECGADRDDPELGPNVVLLPNGEPSGVLREKAWFAYAAGKVLMPGPDIDEEVETDLMHGLNRLGITTFCDCSGILEGTNYDALERMDQAGRLTVRINLNPAMEPDEEQTEILRQKAQYHSPTLQVTGVKGVVDGVTSTFTGYLLEPYSDRPETVGAPTAPREYFEKCIIAANRKGLGARLHCIGDAAVRMALDMFEASNKVNDNTNVRNTIEHIESIHPDDIPRFKELHVVASMQPRHLPLDANEKISRVGPERCRWEWPHRSILDAGGILAFGTDFPVVEYNPFESIYYAITRNGYDGKPTGVNPEQAVTMAEALRAYTWAGQYASGRDGELGTLEPGKLADVIVLDRNLFDTEAEAIPETKVLLTVFDGTVIYQCE